jgi:hypothetical protein
MATQRNQVHPNQLPQHGGLAALSLVLVFGLSACNDTETTGPDDLSAQAGTSAMIPGGERPAASFAVEEEDPLAESTSDPCSARGYLPPLTDHDLVVIGKSSTPSGFTELHPLSRASEYRDFLFHKRTALHPTDSTWAFAAADWSHDGYCALDLVGIKKAGTGSGRTEIHVLSGKDDFARFLYQGATALPQTGRNFEFALTDWDKDYRFDLVAIKKSSTGTGRTEIHILSAASGFQRYLLQIGTALHATDGTWQFAVADWDRKGRADLIGIKKSGTGSGRTEVHILSGESNFQQFVLQVATPIEQTGANWTFAVRDSHPRPDLIGVKRYLTGTGTTEVHILSGAANFQSFLLQTGTALQPVGSSWEFITGARRTWGYL